ncbi:MAG: DUF4105 domain-containing protein [Candidatus Azobacteroides pseudotrichonymphae]|jgi:hypothetical protein|uniref:Uncharacterized protein n=1 Tax=Azobacteroides pseudotrichonymphae genomovar. CFP2 TaxID=511995 RepID=B6YQ15_AZOPC|nr:DUF4105 domain-containing protein [Candidatus Azobacteroides pseudotrichonymphae]MDR0530052.1 DUF4105 domain-containing protein [Bacteroidales bacterium OttesenSCG-928-I14]BAG83287.1 conserved hypothetical protein [Candidatus Azobacteroides pseudotrichonymphae genomovar. CFP2]GMO33370.1 MAG: DUF4105 domain-containing protein [Candidatus Azobacteroides pseudotrichonymphae]
MEIDLRFKIKKVRYFIFFLLCVSTLYTSKASKTDDLQVSLLTVMPYSNKVYTIYGHSVLRIHNLKQNTDIVFNWGTFGFDTRYFLYHFLKGEISYSLSKTDYYQFLQCYDLLKTTIIEQILYLSPESKEYLLQMLSVNLHPKNRAYHYNFLKDNCTTHIRNSIEKTIGAPLDIADNTHLKTIRQLIHSYTYPYPWMTFGIDLLVGSEADKPIRKRESLFLPMQLKKVVDNFTYNSGDSLVVSSLLISQSNDRKNIRSSFWHSPIQIGWLILCIYGTMISATTIGICKYQKSRIASDIFRITKVCFAFLFLSAAGVGSLILFLVLFSYHPCTSSNWNLFWVHPFHFIAFIGFFVKKPSYWKTIYLYHWFNLVLLFALLLGLRKSWLPQNLNPAIVPYALCLMLASLSYLIYKYKKMLK